MASLTAKNVARDISENIRKGKLINLGEILQKNGYAKSVTKSPSLVTKTKSFQLALKPLLPQIETLRQKFVTALDEKNLSREKTAVLLAGLDILTKNAQLLAGKATENIAIVVEISETIAAKNATKDAKSQ